MLNQLDLSTFKCFELLRLPLAPLTLLCGTNASGKSSVLQSIALLHQTMRDHEWSTRLMLNGSLTKLGTVTDVVDQLTGRGSFDIGLTDQDINCRWEFSGDRQDMSLKVKRVQAGDIVHDDPAELRFLLPVDAVPASVSLASRVRDLTYITLKERGRGKRIHWRTKPRSGLLDRRTKCDQCAV